MNVSVDSLKTAISVFLSKTNRYILAIGLSVAWLLFFDSFTIVDLVRLNSTIKQLEKQIAYHENVSKVSIMKMNDLKNNPETLEKYAREQYGMKRPNEDVFVIK